MGGQEDAGIAAITEPPESRLTVLVTGGGGFLGSSICRQLADRGDAVIAYQRSGAPQLAERGVRVRQGDITDFDALATALAGCDAAIHTAGKAGIWGAPSDYHRVNVDGTDTVIRACRSAGVACLVHTSSPSIVHTGSDMGDVDESVPVASRFKAPYPASKAEAERRIVSANSESLLTTALRPHLIWGPGDPHILPRLAAKAKGGTLALPGPEKRVDTIFVENAALAHLKALDELRSTARCAGKAYFVTNDEPLPQGEIIARMLQAIGMEVRIRAVPVSLALAAGWACETAWKFLRLKSEPPVTRFSVEQLATEHWFDTSASKRDFGYRPRFTIEQGLEALRESVG